MIQGTLYVISAPSGTGKSSLIKALLKTQLSYNIRVSISHTTRMKRTDEKNGEHYFFITKEKFQKMIKHNDFFEYAYIFGNYYGTSRSINEKILNSGVDVFLEIDWQGAQQIRNKMPRVCTIFILPPSKNELMHRLYTRGQDSEENINIRIKQTITEIKHYREYDYIIINDDFNIALDNLKSIIKSRHLKLKYQMHRYDNLINKLLED
ncbi:Guanylate kinase [Candidatus Arsenophonus lipoptenae]|uniref:Guanylate kinase n=1 Tax=Candidatus Arsenophonus lipoptenae TaxID=634113 RepID=A0A120HPU3_9GAMM|nr:guanylate kinase [Candidatus Arsenophonus lipoptenae]AMA64785.1 Guanylate kinase [Candidatus Arsenophonus lipoptenae]